MHISTRKIIIATWILIIITFVINGFNYYKIKKSKRQLNELMQISRKFNHLYGQIGESSILLQIKHGEKITILGPDEYCFDENQTIIHYKDGLIAKFCKLGLCGDIDFYECEVGQ